jgi:Tfp pilus assembly PilM family ATPase
MKLTLPDGLYAAFDLGSHAVKAILLEKTEGKLRLTGVESETLKSQNDFPGESEFRTHQFETLRDLAAKLPLRQCRECFALYNSRETQVKIVDLPREILPDQVSGVLFWEAKKLLSPAMKTEPFLFAYRRVQDSPPAYAVAVIPTSRVQRLLELYEQAGVTVSGLYSEVFTVSALKACLPASGFPAYSLINIGFYNTYINIFAGGNLKFFRHIPSGLSEFSEVSDPREFEVFSQKIRFSFDYFRAVSKLPQIDDISLMGGGATHKEFLTFSRDYFQPSKVTPLDLSSLADVSPVLAKFGGETSRLLPFLPAITCFFAHNDPQAEPANFAAGYRKILEAERYKRWSEFLPLVFGFIGVLIIAGVVYGLHATADAEKVRVQKAVSIAEQDVGAARIKVTRLQSSTVRFAMSEPEKRFLKDLLRPRPSPDAILFKVVTSLPEGVTLKSLHLGPAVDDDQTFAEEAQALPVDEAPPKAPADNETTVPGAPQAESEPRETEIPATTNDEQTSALNAANLSEKTLVLKGTAETYDHLLIFVEKLKAAGAIKRYQMLQSARKPGEPVRFAVMGELP